MWQQDVIYRSYTINYYSNVGSPSNMPSTQTGSVASTNNYQVTLRSNIPTLSDYTFQGWCTSSNITNNGTANTPSCTGTKYNTSDTVTIGSNNQTISLYAMWKGNFPASCSGPIPASPNATFGGKRWTTTQVTCNWADANKVCPSGYHLPSKTEFDSLISAYGSGAMFDLAHWPTGSYWSSTLNGIYYAYSLTVVPGGGGVTEGNPGVGKVGSVDNSYFVRCVD